MNRRCPNCNEPLPVTVDAFCGYCREPIDPNETIEPDSDGKIFQQGRLHFNYSQALEILSLVASVLFGICTLLAGVNGVLRFIDPQNDEARNLFSLVLTAIWLTTLGLITFGFYAAGMNRLIPQDINDPED